MKIACLFFPIQAKPKNQLSDEAIIVVTEEGLFRAESLASRISYLTVMDILYTNTMYHNFDQNADSLKKIRDNISTTKTDPHYLS